MMELELQVDIELEWTWSQQSQLVPISELMQYYTATHLVCPAEEFKEHMQIY